LPKPAASFVALAQLPICPATVEVQARAPALSAAWQVTPDTIPLMATMMVWFPPDVAVTATPTTVTELATVVVLTVPSWLMTTAALALIAAPAVKGTAR
jgi:hypothetical protein